MTGVDNGRDLRPLRLPLALDARDVATVLGVSERTGQRWLRAGKLGSTTELGGRLRVRRDFFWAALKGSRK